MSKPASSSDTAATTGEDAKTSDLGQADTAQAAGEEVKPKENGVHSTSGELPKPAKPKYRHDWYQTPTDVYINVMIKGLKSEDVDVKFGEKMVCFYPPACAHVCTHLNPTTLASPYSYKLTHCVLQSR